MEIITRKEAAERGLKHFFSGKPCKHGHLDRRHASNGVCVSCAGMHNKANVGKYQETRDRWREENKSRVQEQDRVRARLWHHSNKDRYRETNRAWATANREHLRTYQRQWRDENRESVREQLKRNKLKWGQDPIWRLKGQISALIRQSFNKNGFRKGSRSEEILGCNWSFFVSHIERQFLKGMSWDNRHLWHIDHITPLSTAVTEADVIALNHVSNLRPIWASANIAKSDKILFLI